MCLLRKIGLAVKSIRLAANMTQEELADRLGKTSKTISNIERGTVAPSIETLYEISNVLKMPMSDLFVGVDREHSEVRIAAELRALELLRNLSDKDLELAIAKIESIARRS